jgi:hypothetical protein
MWLLVRKILPLALVALYILSPIDAIPDFLVGLGWIDDLVLLGLLIWFLSGRSVPLFGRFDSSYSRQRRSRDSASRRQTGQSDREETGSRTGDDPYAILGVTKGATYEEIKEAYRVAASKYHPDKVAHLGREFQDLAHRKFLAIQKAYARLTKKR